MCRCTSAYMRSVRLCDARRQKLTLFAQPSLMQVSRTWSVSIWYHFKSNCVIRVLIEAGRMRVKLHAVHLLLTGKVQHAVHAYTLSMLENKRQAILHTHVATMSLHMCIAAQTSQSIR